MEPSAGRVHRTVAEKRRIVELTLAPGMSVARVAQAESVNSHQVFQWRRAFQAGGLLDRSKKTAELLPVIGSTCAGLNCSKRECCPGMSRRQLDRLILHRKCGRTDLTIDPLYHRSGHVKADLLRPLKRASLRPERTNTKC
jgi:transposase-like protein